MNSLVNDLQRAALRGVAPPQDWTTRAIEEIERLTGERDRLIRCLDYLVDNVEEPPDSNCSCFISPPCNDCVEYSGIREALGNARAALAEIEASNGTS